MKLMIRNLLYLFKRFKTAVALNLFGLTITFTASLLIVIQVDYEMNYDTMHGKSGRTFRLEANRGEFEHNAIHCLMPNDAFANSSTHITDYFCRYPFYGGRRCCQIDEVDDQGETKVFKENFRLCLSNISDVFDFHMKEGSVGCLSIPDFVLIPKSVAKRLFDKQSAIGKRTRMSGSGDWQPVSATILAIGGVYRDFPRNATVQNRIYAPMGQLDLLKDSWQMYADEIYVTLNDPLSKKEVLGHFSKTFDFVKSQMGLAQEIALRLTPLKDVYYTHDTAFDFNPKGHRETNYVLLGIAFLILFIAGINFTNPTTSLIPPRLGMINTHRVLGCSIYKLRAISLIESIVICLTSYILALFVVNGLPYTPIANWVDTDIRLSQYKGLVLLTVLVVISTGCLTGLYPAMRSTSYVPALILKGSFGLSSKGKKVRVALIDFQYTVSIALIIVTLFMELQNHFMTSSEQLGSDKDRVVTVNLIPEAYAKHKPQCIQKLKDYPGIEDVAFSVYELSKGDSMIDLEYARHEDKGVFFKVLYASENFLSAIDIQVEEGGDSTREGLDKAQSDYIVNPVAERDFHLHPEDCFNDRTVLGVSKDFRLNSCRITSSPFIFALNNDIPNPKLVSYIRFNSKTSLQEAVIRVRETLREIDPTFPFEISFYNTISSGSYQKEQTLGKLISLFGIVTILISIIGVFELVLFETQYRRKEIGIRRISGATIEQILLMFNKTYVRIVSVYLIISVPIAWMGTQQWLENFVYRTLLHLWILIVAFLIILSVTVSTVTFRNWQTANENPVNSVKSE